MLKKIFTIALLAIIAITGCKKAGCTDAEAANYDEDAVNDDESCKYTAQMVFYASTQRRTELVADGTSTPADVYVNGEKVGSFNWYNSFDNDIPDCNTSYSDETYLEVVKYTFELLKSDEDAVDVEFKSGEDVISSSNTLIEPGDCKAYSI